MNHVIAKTVFNVQADKSLGGFALQQELSTLFWQKLAKTMDTVFNDLNLGDNTLIINALELDLGKINSQNWQESVIEKFSESLKQVLQKQVREAASDKALKFDKKQDTATRILLQRERLFEAWLHFLQNGTLPPSVSSAFDEPTLQKAVIETLTLSEWAENAFLQLLNDALNAPIEQIQRSASPLARLVLQFDEPFLAKILAVLTRSNLDKLPQLRQSFGLFLEKQAQAYHKHLSDTTPISPFKKAWKNVLARYSKTLFWASIFQKIVQEKQTKLGIEQVVMMPFATYFEKTQRSLKKEIWLSFFSYNLTESVSNKPAQPEGISSDFWLKTQQNIVQKLKIQVPDITKSSALTSKKGKNREGDSKAKDKTTNEDEKQTTHYVQNAGVILTHAFLPMFFKALKLLNDKNQFKNERSRHCAIHLIEYIASGVEGLPEYRLLLPKLLCGLPFDVPLDRQVTLTKKQKKETEAMLKAIVSHWEALGNASTEALRQGFFKREGKLSQTDKGQLLQIEQRTEDILLTRLPWSISMIKLPWMKEMLLVEWA